MFSIEMLPAGLGDCLWIEYGEGNSLRRILIDGGIASTYHSLERRIRRLPACQRHFELFIITHIDADHIEGAIKLLGNLQQLGVTFGDVWFNGWRHLLVRKNEGQDEWLGGLQGEFLSALIELNELPWNEAFAGAAVVVPASGKLPQFEFPGGLKLTLLSPTTSGLLSLSTKWLEEVRAAGLDRTSIAAVLEVLNKRHYLKPMDDLVLVGQRQMDVRRLADRPFVSDTTKANGSSIAVLAEYEDKCCLLTGDAHVSILCKNIQRLIEERGVGRLLLNALKLPHHGSKGNISVMLLEQLACHRYLFSTNGSRFCHPDREAVARIIVYGGTRPVLIFNYYTEFNNIWNDPELMNGEYPYEVHYPSSDDGIMIEL